MPPHYRRLRERIKGIKDKKIEFRAVFLKLLAGADRPRDRERLIKGAAEHARRLVRVFVMVGDKVRLGKKIK